MFNHVYSCVYVNRPCLRLITEGGGGGGGEGGGGLGGRGVKNAKKLIT